MMRVSLSYRSQPAKDLFSSSVPFVRSFFCLSVCSDCEAGDEGEDDGEEERCR